MPRKPELDALRGLAALLVLHYHFAAWEGFPAACWQGAWMAVDLFFVLSGYLITGILLRHGNEPGFLPVFYARRALRLWPAYYAGLAAVLLLNRLAGWPKPTDGMWWNLAFLQNLPLCWGAEPPPFDWHFQHSWSLAVEEQFYLLWPLLVGLAGRRVGALCLAVFLLSAAASLAGFDKSLLLSRAGGLALGAWLAVGPPRKPWLGLAALASFAWLAAGRLAHGPAFLQDGPLPILAASVMATGLVSCVVRQERIVPLRWAPLRWLGTISFGLYLWHGVLSGLFRAGFARIGLEDPLLRYLAYWPLSVGAAALSWLLLEAPLLRLKDHLPYGGVTAPPASSPASAPCPGTS
ncbi:MAG: acyltransferase [Gemmataceae bacterium]|nr:acyltransferase [Gemmataceae bacterium]